MTKTEVLNRQNPERAQRFAAGDGDLAGVNQGHGWIPNNVRNPKDVLSMAATTQNAGEPERVVIKFSAKPTNTKRLATL